MRFPKIKDYNAHQSTRYIPRYIAGSGPIKQQRERGPHYHHNVQENVLYNNSLCEVRLVGSLGLVAKGRLQFTSEPPLARALQLD